MVNNTWAILLPQYSSGLYGHHQQNYAQLAEDTTKVLNCAIFLNVTLYGKDVNFVLILYSRVFMTQCVMYDTESVAAETSTLNEQKEINARCTVPHFCLVL